MGGWTHSVDYSAVQAVRVMRVVVCASALFASLGACSRGEVLAGEQATERCLAGGSFVMGSDDHYPEERQQRSVVVDAFCIDRHEVSNAEFAEFVAATNYKTVAETGPDPKDYPNAPREYFQPGSAVFVAPARGDMPSRMSWWTFVPSANWRAPAGSDSSIEGAGTQPVVHVAYQDALAYAKWRGRDLPTEAEWEYAARGGLAKKAYAWGDQRTIDGREQANTWQGTFPTLNTNQDGYVGLAPVGSFPANGFGLHDMIGNVWEWTKTEVDWGGAGAAGEQRAIKGGSFLCAPNFCARYRPAARQAQDTGLGTNHIGFRTVRRQ